MAAVSDESLLVSRKEKHFSEDLRDTEEDLRRKQRVEEHSPCKSVTLWFQF